MEVLTGQDVAGVYSRSIGREIRYGGNDLDVWEEKSGQILPGWLVRDLKLMYEFFQRYGLRANETDFALQAKVLGHPPRSFHTFVEETVAAWERDRPFEHAKEGVGGGEGRLGHKRYREEVTVKLFLDTANVKEIQEAASLGLLDGVTTNPSLVAKEGRKFDEALIEMCNLVDGPISAEVVSLDAEAMVQEGQALAKIHQNIVVKVPLVPEGLKATQRLTAEGIKVNVTLCFSPTQALLAAKAGAWCVSPFIGRLDDISWNGMELIRQIMTIYKHYDFKTLILVASVRHPQHVVEAALAGGDICTMPFSIFQQLVKHPLTDLGMNKFLTDWKLSYGSN
jgi:transaldolase